MTPAQGHLPPRPLHRLSMGLPARPCPHPPTPLHRAGSWGSLPISAAQLPAVLILAALRVIHLVDTETFLEVLGPDLGIQDFLGHVAGEPAPLLVMQTLAKDPPCTGRGRGGSGDPAGAPVSCPPGHLCRKHRRGDAGVQWAFLSRGTCSANPCWRPSDWLCPRCWGGAELTPSWGALCVHMAVMEPARFCARVCPTWIDSGNDS